jgi:hypothetical protein
MLSLNDVHASVVRGALYGGVRGGAVGAAASLASGAAIVTTLPAWLPFIGGSAVVALGTVALLSTTGSAMGAIVAAARAYWKHNQEEHAFNEAFPPQTKKDIHES